MVNIPLVPWIETSAIHVGRNIYRSVIGKYNMYYFVVLTHLKNMFVKLDHGFPQGPGWKFEEYFSCHQLGPKVWLKKTRNFIHRSLPSTKPLKAACFKPPEVQILDVFESSTLGETAVSWRFAFWWPETAAFCLLLLQVYFNPHVKWAFAKSPVRRLGVI